MGIVHGGSDRWAACPASDPVSPDDLGATTLHALEIDPATEYHDPTGRPMRINSGRPLAPLVYFLRRFPSGHNMGIGVVGRRPTGPPRP
ncbi:MAG TPA: DUF1501 domain-containing protein [Isosphaeraceae bacterium]|nr:DUF1501 domain-containing protein [Isosphaeraceae bacterium]